MEVSRLTTSSNLTCLKSLGTCILLLVTYVGSLYMWKSRKRRGDPSTIKQRFISVLITSVIAPIIVYTTIDAHLLEKWSLAALLGIRTSGLAQVILLPVLLTSAFYLGPLLLNGTSDIRKLYSEPSSWREYFKNLAWWRNYVVGPISEELVFRACMLPVLLQCFGPFAAILICSLFFGIAHIHHFHERLQEGYPLLDVIVVTAFQCCFTTAFGAYSAYLFVRTGHLLAPCFVHSFCNLMGIPDFHEILKYEAPRRFGVAVLYVAGIILWWFLLKPLTNPALYSNDLFWCFEAGHPSEGNSITSSSLPTPSVKQMTAVRSM